MASTLLASACAVVEPAPAPQPAAPAVAAPAAPAAPVAPQLSEAQARARAEAAALAEEARALLAQAETDVQRARARRALWQKAWEDLVAARQAMASGDAALVVRHARRASEFAQLGLEQLAYPAVK